MKSKAIYVRICPVITHRLRNREVYQCNLIMWENNKKNSENKEKERCRGGWRDQETSETAPKAVSLGETQSCWVPSHTYSENTTRKGKKIKEREKKDMKKALWSVAFSELGGWKELERNMKVNKSVDAVAPVFSLNGTLWKKTDSFSPRENIRIEVQWNGKNNSLYMLPHLGIGRMMWLCAFTHDSVDVH